MQQKATSCFPHLSQNVKFQLEQLDLEHLSSLLPQSSKAVSGMCGVPVCGKMELQERMDLSLGNYLLSD